MRTLSEIRNDFPILKQSVNQTSVVFLDTGASAQKPQCVIDAEKRVYETYYANIHRGVYEFSQRSTTEYENVRTQVQSFIKAKDSREIIFTKGATESINLVAHSYGNIVLNAGDKVMISEMEHHANIVPWQVICEARQAELVVIPILEDGALDYQALDYLLDTRVKIVAITQASNVLGTVNDLSYIIEKAHAVGAAVLVDGAQGIVHAPLDVTQLDVDFYVFSAHKLYGPTGVGVLYGKKALLDKMPVYQTGGDMIDIVTFEKTTYAPLPNKFEAGTPNIAGVIAFGEALRWIESIGFTYIQQHENELLVYATEALKTIPEVTIYGTTEHKIGVISFTLKGIHPHDIGTLLDHYGIAIRVGHHCAQPIMQHYKIPATARISFGIYNTKEEIDYLIQSIKKVIEMFS